MRITVMAALALLGPGAALAQDAPAGEAAADDAAAMAEPTGDAVAGEEHFNRQCVACHVVRDEATGEVLAGRTSQVGPNLHGVVGRVPGSYPDYDYSELLAAYGTMETEGEPVVWHEENFVGFVQNPTGHLREVMGQEGRSKMSFQVRNEEQARDIYAFLATFSDPAEGAEGEAAEGGEAGEAATE